MKKGFYLTCVFALSCCRLTAQAPSASAPITVVEIVDIIPDAYQPQAVENASVLLRTERDAAAHDAGLVAYTLVQRDDATNHFTVLETWRDRHAYEHHEGTAHAVQFRLRIQPLLGAPMDIRVYHPFR